MYILGTYVNGSNLTLPRPRQSRFFKTVRAGFIVLENGAAYFLDAGVLQAPPSTYYVRIEYENPQDKNHPFVNDMELTPTTGRVQFSSPDVVSGIRNYRDYTIRVQVFTSRGSTEPIDTMIQPIRSYVDTTTPEVRVYKEIEQKR